MFSPLDQREDDPKIAALIDKAHAARWSPTEVIDWNRPIALPPNLPAGVYVDMVSQLYYSEQASIEVLGRLICSLPEFQARMYLSTQAADEARHAQGYRMYLHKLGDIAPIDPSLRSLFERALAYEGPAFGLVVAMNLVMEHEALAQQRKRIETLPCPVFRDLNRAIIRDEARHAAFGVLYLTTTLRSVSAEEKEEVLAWIQDLWHLWVAANKGRYESEAAAVLRLGGEELSSRWGSVTDQLKKVGLLGEVHADPPPS